MHEKSELKVFKHKKFFGEISSTGVLDPTVY